ncbi:MAG: S41 family peptidase [Candidatus Electryonea clarkiae]|nr:S41 family peptidase [Candidatus Electryonea clarkiae]MDP8288760.1 S41 family peptidase [Candidatus Electryonea clarkiae]
MSNKKKINLQRAFVLAVVVSCSFWLGIFASNNLSFFELDRSGPIEKFVDVLQLVTGSYIDPVNPDTLVEGSIEGMLRRLDPHSVYIPSLEQNQIAEVFAGEFYGIGIQFEIRDNAILVVSPIPGTPADRMGLRAGDRIIEIDGINTIGITNDLVFKRLRGPRGSAVRVKVARNGEESFELILTRGKIPIHSVESAFILRDGITGYILVNQFTAVTASELDMALDSLRSQGMKQLILDLRGNSGGYLSQADEVADRFIEGGQLIVSTDGRISISSEKMYSSQRATIPYLPLIILVNRGSASASEIVAGAIQDLDRGLIIGQPTFGKGLVQSPFQLNDGSVVRLTTARWYTPSGRCVQRPWDEGLGEYLMMSLEDPADTEEADDTSGTDIKSDHEGSTRIPYKTRTGRIVYGESGITPDIIIDPGKLSKYSSKLFRDRVFINWTREFADKLNAVEMPFSTFRDEWTLTRAQEKDFIDYASEQGIEFDKQGWQSDRSFMISQIKAEVAQRLYNGRQYLWQILVTEDKQVNAALEHMNEADELARKPILESNG